MSLSYTKKEIEKLVLHSKFQRKFIEQMILRQDSLIFISLSKRIPFPQHPLLIIKTFYGMNEIENKKGHHKIG